MTELVNNSVSEISESQYVEEHEDSQGYNLNILLDKEKLNKISKIDFTKEKLLFRPGFLTKFSNILLKQKNITYFNFTTEEKALKITGNNKEEQFSMLDNNQIYKMFSRIKESNRNKLRYLFIGGIEVIITGLFRDGIDTPIIVTIRDKRINNYEESILGTITGNLSYNKIKFAIYPQYTVSLLDKNIRDVLTLEYNFVRKDLMVEGNAPINIRYVVGITLSNQTGLNIKQNKEDIEIGPIFEDITNVELPIKNYIQGSPIRKEHNRLILGESNRKSIDDKKYTNTIPKAKDPDNKFILINEQNINNLNNNMTNLINNYNGLNNNVTSLLDQIKGE